MKKIVLGIVAHVDSGKTTLSEGMLYESGAIRKFGRVDKGDSFLDTDTMERSRGITIYAKQAVFTYGDTAFTLLDTPGHVDFSAEMERTLQVLDYAILVISGPDGIQGHTITLWRLLHQYRVPTVIFFNKMDQPGADGAALLLSVRKQFSEGCVDFSDQESEAFFDNIAMTDESAMEEFLQDGKITQERIRRLITQRKIFPCFFGSALKTEGVKELLSALDAYAKAPEYPQTFGARVYKISRDELGNRLTHMKITGGVLRVKSVLSGQEADEKVNQIRMYSGMKYIVKDEAAAGEVCAVTGLSQSRIGEGYGMEADASLPLLEPVLNYRICLQEGTDAAQMLPKLRQLEEEEPELHILWKEEVQEIHAQIMGEVQIEILKELIKERFQTEVSFGTGEIVYKETIAAPVIGVGHFEPLRHYAEVHLLMEPGEAGSGLVFDSKVSEDDLDRNWQRLVLTHLREREHPGVLTGASITDMRITLIAGKAHLKHTEGGDFRQATYRAVRQGLMQAENVLLEPYYDYVLEVPRQMIGRAMTDLELRHGTFTAPEQSGEMALFRGSIPVCALGDYQREVLAYTKGLGRLTCALRGYGPCHNTEEVLLRKNYDPEADPANTPDSVFCAHGAGFIVPWDRVFDYMHLEHGCNPALPEADGKELGQAENAAGGGKVGCYDRSMTFGAKHTVKTEERFLGTEEIDAILEKTMYANRKGNQSGSAGWKRKKEAPVPAVTRTYRAYEETAKQEYLLVDGYNVIFAWEELKELAQVNVDSARGKLMDILCNYQGIRQCELIVVFDAYRVKGHDTEVLDYHNIHVVYTKEAETADQYIEKFAHENGRKYRVTVVTSDGLEQIIIRGQGCALISSREFQEEVLRAAENLREKLQERKSGSISRLGDQMFSNFSKR